MKFSRSLLMVNNCNVKLKTEKFFYIKEFKRNRCSKSISANFLYQNNKKIIEYILDKFNWIMNYYENVSGLSEVRIAQNKVNNANDKMAELQENRRQASIALREIQNQLKQIHVQLDGTKRGEDRYVQLIVEENALLKKEDFLQGKFIDAEIAEREQFNVLSNAVKNSHEKERYYAKRAQLWSIIGSITGALLGIIGTLITNHRRHSNLKELIESKNMDFKEQLQDIRETVQHISNELSEKFSNNINQSNQKSETYGECHLNDSYKRMITSDSETKNSMIMAVPLLCLLYLIYKFSY